MNIRSNNISRALTSNIRRLPLIVVVVALLLTIGVVFTAPKLLFFEEATGLHWLYSLRGTKPPPQDVAIVAINSKSAHTLNLPITTHWPRTVYAELIGKLQQANARSIVLDIAFRDNRSKKEDKALAEAIARAGNVILFKYLKRRQLASEFGIVDIEEEISPPHDLAQAAATVGGFTLPQYSDKIHRTQLYHDLSKGSEATQPLLALMLMHRDATEALYHWVRGRSGSPRPNEDLQTIASYFHDQFASQPQLASRLSAAPYVSGDSAKTRLVYALSLTDPIHINYYGPHRSLPMVDADYVMTADPISLQSLFRGKAVFVGYADDSQTEQRDTYPTVYSTHNGIHLSGVEISATVLANLMEKSVIRAPAPWIWVIIMTGAMVVAAASARHYPLWKMALSQGAIAISYTGLAVFLFSAHALWLPLAAPLLTVICTDLWIFAIKFRRSKLREAHVTQSLEQYLPSNAARELYTSMASIEKRHQIVYGVCMMSDIEGYSRLSEHCQPDELHDMMNRYYTVLIEEVEKHEGMVANIVGDSLLALWIGPTINAELCEKACLTAMDVAKRIDAITDLCATLPTCFAVHAGMFSLGNLGASGHFEYAPVGDIINTTAHIEKLNRALGTRKLVSSIVMENLSAAFQATVPARYLGRFKLHNKSNTVELSSIDCFSAKPRESPFDLNSHFSCALKHYQAADYALARILFSQILEHCPNDGPTLYYYSKCE